MESVSGNVATVTCRPLQWDGRRLGLGAARSEPALAGADGYELAQPPVPGDWWALHWDWLCVPLDRRRLRALQYDTRREPAAVNAAPVPAPAKVLS